MKKSLLLKSILVLIFLSFLSFLPFSCEKNSNEDCSTCQSENYSIVKTNLSGLNLDFKEYNDEENVFHFLFNKFNNSDFKKVFEKAKLDKVREIKSSELVGFCLITDIEKKESIRYNINENNIQGVIFFSINQSQKMNIRVFSNNNNNFVEREISNIEIGYITSNDIVKITNLYFQAKENSTFLITNSLYKMIDGSNNKTLNAKLSKSLSENISNRSVSPPRSCGLGCQLNNGSPCALYNNGSFGCKKDENCPEDDARTVLEDSNNNDYDFVDMTNDLHYFRSNYLLVHSGGESIANDYYELGKNLPSSFYTIENCIELFDILESDVIPLTNELSVNFDESTILIDNSTKTRLTNYLVKIRGFYTNQTDIEKVDNLIIKLEFFTNKSNDYITKNLDLY